MRIELNFFNEFFFYDCVYHGIISIIQLYGLNPQQFLLNQPLKLENSIDKITLETKYKDTVYNLFTLGINLVFIPYKNKSEFCSNIICLLNKKIPVIVYIECYYETIRSDIFQKKFLDHNVVVCGYEEKEELFYIYEHDSISSLDYKIKKISFNELYICNVKYKNNDNCEFPKIFYLEQNCHKKLTNPCINFIYRNYINLDNLDVMKKYLMDLRDFSLQNLIKENDKIISSLNSFTTLWKVIVYIIPSKKFCSIENHFEKLRYYFLAIVYSKVNIDRKYYLFYNYANEIIDLITELEVI